MMNEQDEAVGKDSPRGVPARVFIIDDHPLIRRGLNYLLSLERDIKICGEASHLTEALATIQKSRADVAIMDLTLKRPLELEAIHQLRAACPQLKILVFSMYQDRFYVDQALQAGAHGYVFKQQGAEKAVAAIREIVAGRQFVSEPLQQEVSFPEPERPRRNFSLNPREE